LKICAKRLLYNYSISFSFWGEALFLFSKKKKGSGDETPFLFLKEKGFFSKRKKVPALKPNY